MHLSHIEFLKKDAIELYDLKKKIHLMYIEILPYQSLIELLATQ